MKYILIVTMLVGLIGLTSCKATNDTNSTNSTNSTINNQTNALINTNNALEKIVNNQYTVLISMNNALKEILNNQNKQINSTKLINELQKNIQKIKLYFYIFVGLTIALILSIAILEYYFYKTLTKKIYENKEYAISMTTVFSATLANMKTNQEKTNEALKQNQNDFVNNFVKENKALVIEQAKKIQDLTQVNANQNAEIEKLRQLAENLKANNAKLKEKYNARINSTPSA